MQNGKPAVLFVNVLWTEHYNGTEKPQGNFAYLDTERFKKYGASDEHLFVSKNGIHYCGLGRGKIGVEKLDAVFVARDPSDNQHKAVAIFRNLTWETEKDGWTNGSAQSSDVTCLQLDERPKVKWRSGQQNRRWARGGPHRDWPQLLATYEKLNSKYLETKTHVHSADEAQLLELYRDIQTEEQQRVLQQIYRAVRDQQLRPTVLKLWGPSCAACGMSLKTPDGLYECEIAHIHQVRDDGTDSLTNALPMCRTHHWAFDQHLWGIVPKTKHIFVRSEYRNCPTLSGIHDSPLKPVKKGAENNLDGPALQTRWKLARLDKLRE